jgi:hypothetical protein
LVTDAVVGGCGRWPYRPSSHVKCEPGLLIPKLTPFGSDTVVGSHPPWRKLLVQM